MRSNPELTKWFEAADLYMMISGAEGKAGRCLGNKFKNFQASRWFL